MVYTCIYNIHMIVPIQLTNWRIGHLHILRIVSAINIPNCWNLPLVFLSTWQPLREDADNAISRTSPLNSKLVETNDDELTVPLNMLVKIQRPATDFREGCRIAWNAKK